MNQVLQTTFITRGKFKLMKLLEEKGANFKSLFEHPEFMAAEDLSRFISELEKIYDAHCLFDYKTDNIEYKNRFMNQKKFK